MNALLDRDFCAALVLSFGHFLWQGTLVAGIGALIARRPATSPGRYRTLVATLLLMAACPLLTLAVLVGMSSGQQQSSPTQPVMASQPIVDPIPSMPVSSDVQMQRPADVSPLPQAVEPRPTIAAATPPRVGEPQPANDLWRQYAPAVMNLYLAGVALMLLRLLIGLWGGRQLRRRAIPITDASLLIALRRQADALGMKLVPLLAYCERVAVPTVIGILKPTILLPLALTSGLTPDQVESVLAHELAHLRRCDHLVNLMQRVIESLLFFHPAVWWISHRVRIEREHCCDDLVIACGAVPLDYANSLLRVAELSRGASLRRSVAAVSLLATGKPSTLRQRIARLLGYSTDSHVRFVHPWVLFCIGTASLGTILAVSAVSWQVLAEMRRDRSQMTVVAEWSAVVDEEILKEIRSLNLAGTPKPTDTGAETIRCSAEELRAIVRQHLSDQKRVLLGNRTDFVPPSSTGFRRTGIARSMANSETIRDGNKYLSAQWHAGGTAYLEDRANAAGLRLDMQYGFSTTASPHMNATVKFDENVDEGRAAGFVLTPKSTDAWKPSLIVVYEAMRVPTDQVELFKPLARPDDWIRLGPVGTKERVARAASWRSLAKRDAVTVDPAWTRERPNGGHVQLVALSRPTKAPMVWWDPQGRSISGISPHTYTSHRDRDFVALVRVWETGANRNKLDAGSTQMHGGILELPDTSATTAGSQLIIVPAVLANADGRPRLQIGAGFGAWAAEAELKADRDATATLSNIEIRTASAHEFKTIGKTTTGFRWSPTRDLDLTAVAITASGKAIWPSSNPTVYANEPPNTINGAMFFDHPLLKADIDHFLIKSRPCHWTEFTGFAIEPEEALDPPLDFAKADDAEARDNDEPNAFAAKLPNGIKVDLAGIAMADPASPDANKRRKPRVWWRPDGTKLTAPPPRQLFVDGSVADFREFLVRLTSPGKKSLVTASHISWTPHPGLGSLGSTSQGTEADDPAEWTIQHQAYFKDEKQVAVHIFVSDEPLGPAWLIDLDGKTLPSKEVDARTQALRDLMTVVRVEKSEAETVLRLKLPNDLLARTEFHLRAIDKQGQAHQPFGSRGSNAGDGRVFQLAAADLKHFEIRLRAMTHEVTFENVSLQPGQTTDVKVKVESISDDPQPAAAAQPELGLGQRLELVQWSHDSKRVFATGSFNKLTLWEHKDSGWEPTSLDAQAIANSIAVSRKSSLIVVGTNDGTAEVWDVTTQKRQGELRSSPQYSIYAVAISPDDRLVAACGTDGTVAVFDRTLRQIIARLGEKADTRMASLAFSPDGKTLAAMDRYGRLVLWSLSNSARLAEWKDIGGEDCSVQWSPDGQQLAISGWGRVTLITAEKGSQPRVVEAPEAVLSRYPNDDDSPRSGPQPGGIKFASVTAIAPDLRTVASIAPDASIGIWELASRKLVQKLPAPLKAAIVDSQSAGLRNLTFSPNGQRLACTTLRGEVVFWQVPITNEIIECDIVDAVTGKPITKTTTSFKFIKPKSGDVEETTVSHMIWGPESPSRIYFTIPDEVMRRGDRDELEVQWGTGNHPDYENFSPAERIKLKQFFKEGTKAARDTLSTIKLTPKRKVEAKADGAAQAKKRPLEFRIAANLPEDGWEPVLPQNWEKRNYRDGRLPAGKDHDAGFAWHPLSQPWRSDAAFVVSQSTPETADQGNELLYLLSDKPEHGMLMNGSWSVLEAKVVQGKRHPVPGEERGYAINVLLDDAGAKRFAELVSSYRDMSLAVLMNGEIVGKVLLKQPSARLEFGGHFTKEWAEELVRQLNGLPPDPLATQIRIYANSVTLQETFAKLLPVIAQRAGRKSNVDFETLKAAGVPFRKIVTIPARDESLRQALERVLNESDVKLDYRLSDDGQELVVFAPPGETSAGASAPPKGLEFLKPYPKLHGLSLDMTEPQFLELVKQQEVKTRKTVDGDKVQHHIALGDGHTLIVMFDKGAKCSGIQRVRGEDEAPQPFVAKIEGGPTVELLGMGTHQISPETWWAANGRRWTERPHDRNAKQVQFSTANFGVAQSECRELLMRVTNLPEGESHLAYQWQIDGFMDWAHRGVVREPTEFSAGFWPRLGRQTPAPKSMTLRVGIGELPDDFVRTLNANGEKMGEPPTTEELRLIDALVQPVRVEETKGKVELILKPTDRAAAPIVVDYVPVAVDKSGKAHERSALGQRPGLIAYLYPISKQQLDHFECRFHRYRHQITFESVSLVAGYETDVKVKVDPPLNPAATAGDPRPAQDVGQQPAQAKQQPDKSDQERMVGNWLITNDDSMRPGEMWVIDEDRILMYAKHGGLNANLHFHRLDSGKDPKQIDITVTLVNGPTVGVTKGIYILDGDELRLCLGALAKDRPAAFPQKPGPGEVLILRRSNPAAGAADPRRAQNNSGGPPELQTMREPSFRLPGHSNITGIGFDNNSTELIAVSAYHFATIRRWDLVGLKLKSDIMLSSDQHLRPFRVGSFKLSGDGRRVIAATDDFVGIWNTSTGELLKKLPFPTRAGIYDCWIDKLDCTPDLSVIAGNWSMPGRLTLAYDAHVMIWDGNSGNLLQTVIDKNATDLKSIDLSSDGKLLATTNGGGAKVWETSSGKLLRSFPNDNKGRKHSDPEVTGQYNDHVWSVQLSPDGKQVAMGDILGVKLLDVASGKLLQLLEGPHRYGLGTLVFSKDGGLLARTGTGDRVEGNKTSYVVPIWSTQTGEKRFELHTESGSGAFSDDNKQFAVGLSDRQMALAVYQLSGSVANTTQLAPESTKNKVEVGTHYRGKKAEEFIDNWKPVWGEPQLGIRYGIALTTPQRQFRNGERVPLVVFFRNASNKSLKVDMRPDFFGNTPKVIDAKGMTVGFETVPLLGSTPHYVETLEPGEAVGPLYLNFGLGENPRPGQQNWHPYWKTPAAGNYKLTHSVSIKVAGPEAKPDAASNEWKSGDLASGTIELEIADVVKTENKKEEPPEPNAVRERASPLEFRVAVNPADGDAGPRVPADFLKRHYPDNTPAGRAAAKDRGFIWIPVAKPRDGGVMLPVEASRGEVRLALLGDTTDTAFLLDGERRVVKCEAVRDQNQPDQQSIQVTLDEPAGAALRRLTKAHLNQKLAVVVEGKIIAGPTIRSVVGTDVMITGNFSRDEADKLVAAILSRNEPGDKPKPTGEGGKTENKQEESQKPNASAELSGRLYVNVGLRTTKDEKRFSQSAIAIDPNAGNWTRLQSLSESGFTVPLSPVRVSPDGRTMLFMREKGLWKCDAATGDRAERVLEKGSPAAWSPDSKTFIAVVETNERDAQLVENWIVNTDGQKQSVIALPKGDAVEDWSADGQWLVVRSRLDSQIYLVKPDGTGRRRLADSIEYSLGHTSFSPDSRRIVYLSRQMLDDKSRFSLRTINVDGTGDRELLSEKKAGSEPDSALWTAPMAARWSPDGKHLAVVLFDHTRDGGILAINGNWRLAMIDADGGNLRELKLEGMLTTVLPWDGPEWRPVAPGRLPGADSSSIQSESTTSPSKTTAAEADTAATDATKQGVQAIPPLLEFRFAAQPADSKFEPRVPADFEKRTYPHNSAIGRMIVKDKGFVWVGVFESEDAIPALPVERPLKSQVREALLADTPEYALSFNGKWSVEECRAVPDPNDGDRFGIELKLDEAGGAAMRTLTKSHLNQPLAILVNNKIIAAPLVRSEIGRDIAITGNFTRGQAEKLTTVLLADRAEQSAKGDVRSAIRRGQNALDRTKQLNPTWGEAKEDLQIGLVRLGDKSRFRPGERVPLEIYIRNVGQKSIAVQFTAEFYSNVPSVRDPNGKEVIIEPLILLGARARYRETLKPGEAVVYPHWGLGIGATRPADYNTVWQPFVAAPITGTYTVEQGLDLTITPEGSDASKGVNLSTGLVKFEVEGDQAGALQPSPQDSQRSSAKADDVPRNATPALPTVTGTVVALDGQPVAGIEVVAFEGEKQLDQKFKTDERGQFRVPKAWREVDHWLTVVARDGTERLGWFDFFLHGHADQGQKSDDGSFKIVLLPLTRTVRGRVVDDTAKPLAGIPVRVEYLQHEVNFAATRWQNRKVGDQLFIAGATTGAEGLFELKLPAETFAWLRAAHPDWTEQRIQAPKDAAELSTTKLVRAAKVSGQVIDSRTGKPAAGVSIGAQAIHPDLQNGGSGEATTDTNGRYVIGGLPAGEFNILLFDGPDKTLTAPAHDSVLLKSGQTHSFDFLLRVGQRLSGRVVDEASGKPVPDCSVGYYGPARPRSGGANLTVTANDRGEFEMFVPPGASYVYVAEVRDDVTDSSRDIDVPADRDPAPVVLKAGPKTEGGLKVFVGPPLERKVSLKAKRTPLVEALNDLGQQAAVKLDLDGDGLKMVGYTKNMPVTMELKSVALREALTKVLQPYDKLAFTLDKDQIFVSNRDQVAAREATNKRQSNETSNARPSDAAPGAWGKELNGLRTRVTSLTEKPAVGQPLRVKIELQNVGQIERTYQSQRANPDYLLEVVGPDGKPAEFINGGSGIPVQSLKIKPDETVVLWEDVDVASMYLLANPGRYEIKLRGPDKFDVDAAGPERAHPNPASNTLAVTLAEGTLNDIQATFVRIRNIAPKDWNISTRGSSISNIQKAITRRSEFFLLFTKERQADDQKFGTMPYEYLGLTRLGHAYLATNAQAQTEWPECVDKIREQLPPANTATGEWGKELNGLRTRITLLSEKPAVGQPLKVKIELQNVGKVERTYQSQRANPDYRVEVVGPDGKPAEFINGPSQVQVSSATIKPDETIVLWESIDIASMFLLPKPGRYEIKLRGADRVDGDEADPERVLLYPTSNALSVALAEGTLNDIQATFVRVREIAPKGWKVDTRDTSIVLTSPDFKKGGSGRGIVHLVFVKERKTDEQKLLGLIPYEELGVTTLGHAYVAASPETKTQWPECVEQIRERLPSNPQ